jgi:hypothetical protein
LTGHGRLPKSTGNASHAIAIWLGLIVTSAGPAWSDQPATLEDAIARAFDPAQLSALVAAASRGEPGADRTGPSLEQLQRALGVDSGVAVGLLRILERTGGRSDQLASELAQSATQYHSVIDTLAEMRLDDSSGREMVVRAETAMAAGAFSDAEAELRQLEEREVASSGRSVKDRTAPQPFADQHQLTAAQARTLLGKIALMKLEYNEAAADFQLARQRIADGPSEPSRLTESELPPPGVVVAVDRSKLAMTAPAEPADGRHQGAAAPPPLEFDGAQRIGPLVGNSRDLGEGQGPGHDGQPAGSQPIVTAVAQPLAMITPARRELARPEAQTPVTTAVTKLPPLPAPPTASALSAELVELLLRRGDALLAIGDLASARLLYERAAAAGDARGATGAGKTYDPQVLSQIGARGIQPDPAAAALWYRKALELGDAVAAARLKLLGQAGQ